MLLGVILRHDPKGVHTLDLKLRFLSPFFAILYISSQLGKIYAYFLPMGE